ASLTIGGALKVTARTATDATADARGGSGGGGAISPFFAKARIKPDGANDPAIGTRAHIDAGANVTAAGVDITASDTGTATATLLAASVAVLAGAGGKATATVASGVEAFIGPRTGVTTTTITSPGKAVTVTATSAQT